MAVTIHQDASRFLTLVALQFDRRHFPGAENVQVYKEVGAMFSPPDQRDRLPIEIQAMMQDNANNFAHWLQLTRFLYAPLENANDERRRQVAIEVSAKNLLQRLNKPIGYVQSYSEQLLTHVFQDAFTRVEGDARPDDREAIIKLSIRLQPALDNLPLTFRHLKYKVEFVVSAILNHIVAKIVLTYVSYRIAQWAQPRIYGLLSQTVIPRGVNFLINNANLQVIYVVSGAVALVQFAFFHYWKASFTFFIAKFVSGKIHPLVHRVVIVVEGFAFFPSRVVSWLLMSPFSILTTSWSMHNSLAVSLNTTKNASRAAFLEEGGMKAHRAWMELMQEGMRATLVPSQPVITIEA
ncbi:MAG TPA: hypothetical protein VIJ14_02365 [Rhabdochlamydiaceae bacterium]